MKFVDIDLDSWAVWSAEECASPPQHALVSLEQWLKLRTTCTDGQAVGVIVPNEADPAVLRDDLPRISLLALQFPKWTDGRAYSQARLLRTRLGYNGELRATGEVLVDMLPLLHRTGFDAVVLRADQSVAAARHALAAFSAYYQGDVLEPLPIFSPVREARWAPHSGRHDRR